MVESRDGGSGTGDLELAGGELIGDFAIVARLASGGFGTVYRARSPNGDEVAVKVLHAQLAANPTTVTRFEREARAAASLSHPGIVQVLADGRLPDGRPWFAMELLRGRDLEHHLRDIGRCTPAETLPILLAVSEALTVAHAQGIIHRDIKASNVFLAGDRVVLLDFGIAKLLDPAHDQLTVTGTTVGTSASMAPEQTRGGPVDERTDVYALGAMLFYMLTGSKPFSGQETNELRFLNQHARRPRPSTRATLPVVFDAIVNRAMAIDPASRYPTPAALAAAFEQALVSAAAIAPGAREGAAIYLFAEIATVDGSLSLPTEALWNDLEAVRAEFERLAQPPSLVHAMTDTSLLVERFVEAGTVERVVDECRALAARLRARPTPHPSVRVRLTVDGRPPIDDSPPDPREPVVVVVAPGLH